MTNLIGTALAQVSRTDLKALQPVKSGDLRQYIVYGINAILVIAGILAVIFLIYGGILYITAGGDAEKATKGRTAVVNAIIGIVIILLAIVIVQWVRSLVAGTPV